MNNNELIILFYVIKPIKIPTYSTYVGLVNKKRLWQLILTNTKAMI